MSSDDQVSAGDLVNALTVLDDAHALRPKLAEIVKGHLQPAIVHELTRLLAYIMLKAEQERPEHSFEQRIAIHVQHLRGDYEEFRAALAEEES